MLEEPGIWEPPYIQPHKIGALNKFGQRTVRDNVVREVFGIPVSELVRQYGSPVFVVGEQHLRANIRRIRTAFDQRYNLSVHGWSYKTNYTSAICRIMHQEGSLAEVVSKFEYEKARHLGVPGKQIVFNGPNKPKDILQRAAAEGALIQADHMDELKALDTVANELGVDVKIGIRINFDTGFTEPWSRFGFNLETGQVNEAINFISRSAHLRLSSLHSHIGTFVLEPRAYSEQVRIMCELMQKLEGVDNVAIDTIDVGGGIPSRNALQTIYLPPDQVVPDVGEYADAICEALLSGAQYRRAMGKELPRLIYESGRAVVDDAEQLVTSVVGTKRLPDGRRAAILDAGTNLLFTAYWYNHQVKLTRNAAGSEEDTVLYGPLCMNIDVVRSSIKLPPLAAGDHLVISPVGAYNNTQWLQFIEYRPNVVLAHESGECSVIRRAEDLAVMCAQDQLPPHLENLDLDKKVRPLARQSMQHRKISFS